jgi:cbb3-type cytochrome oxidase cytochrome c subunit
LPFLQGSLNIGPRLGKVGDTSFWQMAKLLIKSLGLF